MKNRLIVPISSIALALLGGACGGDDSDSGGVGGQGTTGGSSAIDTGGAGPMGGAFPGSGGTSTGIGGAGQGVGGTPGTGGVAPAAGGAQQGIGGATPSLGGAAQGIGGSQQGIGGATAGTGGVVQGTGGAGATGSGGDQGVGGSAGDASGGSGMGGSAGDASGGSAGQGTGGDIVVDPELITSSEGAFWVEGELTDGGGSVDITVNETQEHQTWHGFGGTFNEAGWDALLELTDSERAEAIKLLFDEVEGIGFTWGRIPIGASDYAMDRYTLNDNAGDTAMAQFSIDRDRQLLIPFIKAAQGEKDDIKFWGSPWTPPPWMKDNNAYDKGIMQTSSFDAMALYFVRFVEEYGNEGIPISVVMPQNEPGWQQDYPSCAWGPGWTGGNEVTPQGTPVTLGTFVVDHLAPAIQSAGLDTRIWYGTFSNNNVFEAYWSGLSAEGRGLIEGVAFQWGTMGRLDTVRNADPSLLLMQSEHKCGNYPWSASGDPDYYRYNPDQTLEGTAPNDYNYGRESWDYIKQWIEAGVHVYSAWNMVLDTSGLNLDRVRPWHQNALLVVDRGTKALIKTPTYYVFRHVAQYVEPGAVRVGVSSDNALAFKNPDGSIVTALYNSGEGRTMTLSAGGRTVQFQMPARGWATVNLQPAG